MTAVVIPGEAGVGPVDAPSSGLAGSMDALLRPVLPPQLVSAMTAPLVLFEALGAALASSSQALILPIGLVLFGLFDRRGRRNVWSASEEDE